MVDKPLYNKAGYFLRGEGVYLGGVPNCPFWTWHLQAEAVRDAREAWKEDLRQRLPGGSINTSHGTKRIIYLHGWLMYYGKCR